MDLNKVYFVIGTSYAGKSTIVKNLAKKHGGIALEENYHDAKLPELDSNEFPNLTYTRDLQDWHEFIRRTPDEYVNWIKGVKKECEIVELQMLEELLKDPEAVNKKIFVDTNICIDTLHKITDTDHVLVMLSDPTISITRFFDRPDPEKQFLYQLMLEEPDLQAALDNYREILTRICSQEAYDELLNSGFKIIYRDENRSQEETVELAEELLKFNVTSKFDGRAQDYTTGRPTYAPEFINCMCEKYGISSDSSIADIGSGTGKFAVSLLEKGSKVFCVEPNDDMRHEAEKNLGSYDNFRSVKGDAENTTLEDSSVDFVTTAQAFHWFDVNKFRSECSRVLKDNGKVFLIWNVRADDQMNRELHEVYTKYCPNFHGFSGGMVKDDPRIREFFNGRYDYESFDNPLFYDKETFIARSLSGSYSLKPGDTEYEKYINAILDIFDRYSENGIVTISNSSVAYIGSVQ